VTPLDSLALSRGTVDRLTEKRSDREWLDAASAVRSLRSARIGFLGHTYPGMLDMYSDFTQVHAQTGVHVEVLEIDELVERVESADAEAVARKGDEIRDTFDLADASRLSLSYYGKRPGPGMRLEKLSMQFATSETEQVADVLEAYERLTGRSFSEWPGVTK